MNEPAPFNPAPLDRTTAAELNAHLQRPPHPVFDLAFEEEEQEFDPWKYWFVVRKRLALIVAVFAAAVLIAVLKIVFAVPLYTSAAVVLIKPGIPDMLAKQDPSGFSEDFFSENYYKTQETILQSRSLAEQVIENLQLYKDKTFLGRPSQPSEVSHLIAAVITPHLQAMKDDPGPPTRATQPPRPDTPAMTGLAGRYLSMLKISIEPDTSLFQIAFTTPDPGLSMRLANAHARAYAQLGIRLHDQANQQVEKFLQRRLVDLRARLEKSEIALNEYRRAHGIIPGLMSLDGKETVVLDRIRDLSRDLTAAQVQRITLEAQVNVINNGNTSALPAVTSNATIQNLQATLNNEYVQIASLSKEFKPGYPPLAQLEASAGRTRESMRQQIQKIVEGLRSSFQAAVDKEKHLLAEMDKEKRKALNLNDAAVKYAMLEREVDANRALTNNVLKRIRNVGLEAESETSNVSVVDPAVLSPIPSSPRKSLDLAIGAVVGLLGALLLAFALEYLSNTLNSPDEVEKFLRLPNLGVVPEFSSMETQTRQLESASRPQIPGHSGSVNRQLVNSFHPYSMVTDAYRSIRTGLLLSRAGSPPKLTLFTSAMKGEGKTLTAVNTALMLAHAGARVLLVDADLRRGCCHTVLGMQPWPGLTELLIGAGETGQMVQASDFPNLSVLMSGSKPPNSTELVGSDRMKQLLGEFAVKYDFVVVDAPPLIPVSDAMLLSTMVDGVILVVDSARTPKKQLKAARTRLEYAGAKIFGFVINRMHPRSFHYHYYYGDYYLEQAG